MLWSNKCGPADFVVEDPVEMLREKLGLSPEDGQMFSVSRVGYDGWFEAEVVQASQEDSGTSHIPTARLRVYPRPETLGCMAGRQWRDYVFVRQYKPRWLWVKADGSFVFSDGRGNTLRYTIEKT
jgi:hypothetical protein